MQISQNSKYYLTSRNYLLESYRKNVTYYIYIIILALLVLIPLVTFYNYNNILVIDGLVAKVNNDYIVKIYIEKDKLDTIKNKKIIYNNQTLSLKIIDISEEFELTNNGLYKEIIIDLKISETDKINNNLIKLNIDYGKTTIFRELIKIIRKE